MPPGPVSPEERGFLLNSRHGGLARGPSTRPPTAQPCTLRLSVLKTKTAESSSAAAIPGHSCRPARPDAQHGSAARPRPVPWAEVRCPLKEAVLVSGALPHTRSERRSPSGVPEEGTGHRSHRQRRQEPPPAPAPPSLEQETPGLPFWLR